MLRVYTLLVWCNIIFGSTDGISVPKNPYTCVIGGGYSGLAIARYLKEYGLNFTVFERTRYVGGTWRFDPHVGVDEDGVPVSTSQYKYLRTNSPRQSMEYKDFPFPESSPSFPMGTCVYKYIMSFVKHFDLMTNIQLRSYVKSVKRVNDKWELSYYNTDNKENYTLSCDFVVVAIGQYVKPHVPQFPGIEKFQGKVIHCHDYKSPEDYKDRKVLLVGSGPSGLDLAPQLDKITNKLVHSHHLVYSEPKLSEKYIRKPDIKEFVHNGAIFNDSSFEEVDDVILATGYRIEHSFLDESSGLVLTSKFVLPLYKQMVNIRHPSMIFIGIVKHFMNRIIDAQAEYISLLISGQFELPSKEKMLEEWVTKYSFRRLQDIHDIRQEVKHYVQSLSEEAGVSNVPPVLIEMIHNSIHNALSDLLRYRDYKFDIIDDNNFSSHLIHNHTEEMKKKHYVQSLSEEAGVSNVPPVLIEMIHNSIHNALSDLLRYRDYKFDIIDDNNFSSHLIHNHTDEMKKVCPIEDF